MRKRKGHGTYEFENIEILYGGATYTVSGNADWEIADHGIGSYEYWGSKETNHEYIAEFFSATIDDIVMEERVEYGTQHLTEEDKITMAELVIEQLNENSNLCDEIAQEYLDEQD